MADESAQPVAAPESSEKPTARAKTHPAAWIAVVGTVVVGSLLIGAVDQVPSPEEDRNAAEALLPADGAARIITYSDGAEWIVETAYAVGSTFLLQQPYFSSVFQIGALSDFGVPIDQQRFWRQTWTDLAGERGQLTELYHLSQSGVRLAAVTGGETGFSYFPGMIVLPADLHDGSTWTSEGDALPQNLLKYSAEGSARAVADGCFETTLDVTYTDPAQGGATWLETSETALWCPGEGLVGSTFSNNGYEGGADSEPADRPELAASLSPLRLDLSEAQAWKSAELPLLVRDPVFGEGPASVVGISGGAVTASGVLVFAGGEDLVAFARDDDGQVVRQWIAHPGGQLIELEAIGDAVLVGTTDRVLQAYDAEGRRAWSTSFDDIVGAPPVDDGTGGVLVVSLDGELRRLDLATGEELWTTRLDGFSSVSPATADGRVFTLDQSGMLRASDLESGEQLWSIPYPDGALLLADSVLYAADSFGGVHAFNPETGAELWQGTSTGTIDSATMMGDLLVLHTSEGTAAFAPDGQLRWVVDAGEGMVTDGERAIVFDTDSALLIDATGQTLAEWPMPHVTFGFSRTVYPSTDGVWIIGSDFSALEVSGR